MERDAKRDTDTWRDFSIKITINRKTLDTNELQLQYRPRDYRSNLKYLCRRYYSIV